MSTETKQIDWTKACDFKMYYDTDEKRNIWVLGYFTHNVLDAYNTAKQFSEATGVAMEKIIFDEILYSRRFKGFKILFAEKQEGEEEKQAPGCLLTKGVFSWLHD